MFKSNDSDKTKVPKKSGESLLREPEPDLLSEQIDADVEKQAATSEPVQQEIKQANAETDLENSERVTRKKSKPVFESDKLEKKGSVLAWWDHHVQSAFDSFQRLLFAPLSSFLTWTAIGIALALPAILFIVLNNVETISERWDNGTRVSVFLLSSIEDADGEILAEKIAQRSDISIAEYVSREDALTFFKHYSGLGEALHNLDENPFPPSIEIQYSEQLSPSEVTQLLEQVQRFKGVESVQLDMEWVQRVYRLMQLGKRLTLVLICLLSLGVLLVVGNTIRLSIENRRDEIVVVKLVGGTNSFVRRPFLYSGFWYGLGGGIVAWLIIVFTLWLIRDPVSNLISSYDSDFKLLSINFSDSIGILLSGVMLGWLGAWLAVSHHLTEIEP